MTVDKTRNSMLKSKKAQALPTETPMLSRLLSPEGYKRFKQKNWTATTITLTVVGLASDLTQLLGPVAFWALSASLVAGTICAVLVIARTRYCASSASPLVFFGAATLIFGLIYGSQQTFASETKGVIATKVPVIGEQLQQIYSRLGLIESGIKTIVDGQVEAAKLNDERHSEILDAIAREKGIDPANLVSLFQAIGRKVPNSDFERAVRAAVEELIARASNPVLLLNDPVEIQNAIEKAREQLGKADVEGALAILAKAEAEAESGRLAEQRSEARLVKERAAILKSAYRWEEALLAFEKAGQLDDLDALAWFEVGDIHKLRGSLKKALAAYENGKTAAMRNGNERDLSESYTKIGDVREKSGDLKGAFTSFQASLDIDEQFAKSDPSNAGWQRDLSVSHNNIGNVLVTSGDFSGALTSFLASHEIFARLAASNSDNMGSQRDLSISHRNIGNVRLQLRDLKGALTSFQASLDIAVRLAASDPGIARWQRDLSSSHIKIGDVQLALDDLQAAAASFQVSHEIYARLAVIDPGNTDWQRNLSISHERIGDIRVASGDLNGALTSFQVGLGIRERLAKSDPSNAQWQGDLSRSYNRIGNVQVALDDWNDALTSFQASYDIAERLALSDPGNAEWQRDLSVSHNKIGDVRVAMGDLSGAATSFQAGLAKAERLAASDPGNAEWQRDLMVSYWKLASAGDQPVQRYRAALDIAKAMQAKGILAPVDEWMVADLEQRLAAAQAAQN